MKKSFKLLAIATLALGVTAVGSIKTKAEYGSDNFEPLVNENVLFRFGLLGDTHIRESSTNSEAKALKAAMNTYRKLDPNLAAIVHTGDVTNLGIPGEYDQFNEIMNTELAKWSKKPQLILSMGNHDYMTDLYTNSSFEDGSNIHKSQINVTQKRFITKLAAFRAATSSDTEIIAVNNAVTDIVNEGLNIHYKLKGYHFISYNPGPQHSKDRTTWNNATDYLYGQTIDNNWLRTQVELAIAQSPNKPVFVTTHNPGKDTVYGSITGLGVTAWGDSIVYNILKDYPQVVNFSGHSHYTLKNATSINQKDYTTVNTGAMTYTEYLKVFKDSQNSQGGEGYIVEVFKDGTLNFKKIDFRNEKYLGQDYKLDNKWSGTKDEIKASFKYTNDIRKVSSLAPTWPSGMVINVDDESLQIPFEANHLEYVDYYELRAYNKTLKSIDSKVQFSTGEFYPQKYITYTPKGLTANCDYIFYLYAYDSFGNESEFIKSSPVYRLPGTFTQVEVPKADLFDLDINTTITDKSIKANQLTLNGITPSGDKEKHIALNGTAGISFEPTNIVSSLQNTNNVTFSVKFNASDVSGVKCPFSFQDGASGGGIGFEINNGKLETWVRIDSSWATNLITPIEKNKDYHAAIVYNGNSIKLYLNGVLAGSTNVSGNLSFTNSPRKFYIGGDTNSSGNIESNFSGKIFSAKIYSTALNNDQACSLTLVQPEIGNIEEQMITLFVVGDKTYRVNSNFGEEITAPKINEKGKRVVWYYNNKKVTEFITNSDKTYVGVLKNNYIYLIHLAWVIPIAAIGTIIYKKKKK